MPNSTPEENLARLAANPYPGRGMVIGLDEIGQQVIQIYWIMGRSENSRNRIFCYDGGRLFTEPADRSKMTDPSLVIYNAMLESNCNFVVSNGSQTDVVAELLKTFPGATLRAALAGQTYEPDPSSTPRITGMCRVRGGKCFTEFALLKKSDLVAGSCVRFYYEYDRITPGFGFCLTTYVCDDNPLPSFTGEPYPLPLVGDSQQILETFWDTLNEENRVSLAVKTIDLVSGRSTVVVRNRFSAKE